ncbi:succinylglutamate desuccinylase / aspartoacylase family protein [Halalkalicoccus paucihalophilus]|uniref:Succinylglutamate desuccinylase / aspartoacylase family protein n=1 Tax=Halalkalicoccus paucihalophilus TaxID=1008153 RepID=A0A151A9D1_9EURY|nr:succinylglutamate desuccinylase/aspartoacylase family protein [Halalkalicoccus paucihalophilus]KYH24308.1 succinylglutamate desuccinylase / aspartoacylase family protein [Halalkalicoccus paucihalophilus]
MKLGTAESEPGEISTGYFSVTELPTGQPEQVPVILADGEEPGPTVWVTGTIHGDEPTGMAAVHEFVTLIRDEPLRGTVVCVPVMNPSGLRTNTRTSYYHGDDPNRHFGVESESGETPPSVQQLICERVYEEIKTSADAVISLHTSWVATYPYTIRPRVSYGEHREETVAVELRNRLVELTEAFGLPIVNQFGHDETTQRSLEHTLTGAAIADGIPAFTPELGGRFVVERDVCEAAVDGLYNVLYASGMVDEPATSSPEFGLPADDDLKRLVHPHTDTAGLVRYRVREGDWVESGEAIADIVTPCGELKAEVNAEHSGYVLSRYERVAVYENDPLLDMAVLDDEPLLRNCSE